MGQSTEKTTIARASTAGIFRLNEVRQAIGGASQCAAMLQNKT
jgi:hypothetical protein